MTATIHAMPVHLADDQMAIEIKLDLENLATACDTQAEKYAQWTPRDPLLQATINNVISDRQFAAIGYRRQARRVENVFLKGLEK